VRGKPSQWSHGSMDRVAMGTSENYRKRLYLRTLNKGLKCWGTPNDKKPPPKRRLSDSLNGLLMRQLIERNDDLRVP
jgi:hypothetical protein